MIAQSPEPLLVWSDPLMELFGFAALFLSAGAVGFHYAALRGWSSARRLEVPGLVSGANRRAAALGLTGAAMHLVVLGMNLPRAAARAHVAVSALVTHDAATMLGLALALLAALGFAVAV